MAHLGVKELVEEISMKKLFTVRRAGLGGNDAPRGQQR